MKDYNLMDETFAILCVLKLYTFIFIKI